MEYRKLGADNFAPSLLGFGCMRFALNPDNSINFEQTEKLLDHAYQNGINYFDTAYPYHNGESEVVVGKILKKYPRDSYFLATKLPCWLVKEENDVYKYFFEQLEKLQTDHIDYYLIHALNKERWDNIKKSNALRALEKLKKEKKILKLGFSFHDDYEVFEQIHHEYDFDFCQIQLNYLDTNYQAGAKGLKLCQEKKIPVMIMEPLRGGNLANVPLEIANEFNKIHSDWSASRWAFQYLIDFDNIQTILSGMNSFDQLNDNLNTFNNCRKLNDSERATIEVVANMFAKRIMVNCTGCNYCMPCSRGVDIPANFAIYNHIYKFDDLEGGRKKYLKLVDEQKASSCVNCKACINKCPQHIQINTKLKDFVDLINKK